MRMNKKSLAAVMLASTLVLSSGCSRNQPEPTATNTDLDALRSEIEALKAENESIKTQMAETPEEQPLDPLTTTSVDPESSTIEATTTSASPHFKDLDDDLATRDMIQDLAKVGVFKGFGSQFKPYEPITRAEYMIWLFKANNALQADKNQIRFAPTYDPGFSDINKSHKAYKYVQALANAGYSVGYDDKTFKPDQPITREEMIGIKVGIDKGKAIGPDRGMMNHVWKFSDTGQVDERFTGYMYWDYHATGPKGTNIERAFGKIGTFKPKQAVTRSEAAATLWQVGHNNAAKVAAENTH